MDEEVFKNTTISYDELIAYGFKKVKDWYQYETKLLNDHFKLTIMINKEGLIKATIWDNYFDEEYTNHLVVSNNTAFVNQVREEYQSVLKDIKKRCTNYAYARQTKRIMKKLTEPEYLFKKYPSFAVFRHPKTKKWYGIIMQIEAEKLGLKTKQMIEVINVKVDKVTYNKGIYPAYHMNKKYWVSIVLDDTLRDEVVLEYINTSYQLVGK